MNPIEFININGLFYILGIMLYVGAVCDCIYKVKQNKDLYFWKIRVLLKATLLSLSHFSPICLIAAAVAVDIGLIILEYHLTQYPKQYPRLWIFANVMANFSLALLIFLPIIVLTFVLVSVIVVCVMIAEGIIHYLELRSHFIVDNNNENS
jgi:hypothetical protein